MTAASDNGAPTPPSPEHHTLGALDVLTIRPEGPLDFERSRDALEALVRHRGFGAAEALLLDLREATCARRPARGDLRARRHRPRGAGVARGRSGSGTRP